MQPEVSLWLGGWNEDFPLGRIGGAPRDVLEKDGCRPLGRHWHGPPFRRGGGGVRRSLASISRPKAQRAFSQYGINSIIAVIAVCAAVTLLFVSRDRAVVLARFLALSALVYSG